MPRSSITPFVLHRILAIERERHIQQVTMTRSQRIGGRELRHIDTSSSDSGMQSPHSEPRSGSIEILRQEQVATQVATPNPSQPSLFYREYPPMPCPTGPGAPLFTGADVTEFLKNWINLCTDHGLSDTERVKRLPMYCELFICDYIEHRPEYIQRDWEQLCKALKEEYRTTDSYQTCFSQNFLECYSSQVRQTPVDWEHYCRVFGTVARRLLEKKEIDNYTAVLLFLRGLSYDMQEGVIEKASFKLSKPSTVNLDEALKVARDKIDFDRWTPKMDETLAMKSHKLYIPPSDRGIQYLKGE